MAELSGMFDGGSNVRLHYVSPVLSTYGSGGLFNITNNDNSTYIVIIYLADASGSSGEDYTLNVGGNDVCTGGVLNDDGATLPNQTLLNVASSVNGGKPPFPIKGGFGDSISLSSTIFNTVRYQYAIMKKVG